MDVSDAKKLKQLEEEPEAETRGGGSDAGQPGSEGRAVKKLVGSASQRKAGSHVMEHYAMSERRACRLLKLRFSTKRYQSRRSERD